MLTGYDIANYQGPNPNLAGSQVDAVKATEATHYVSDTLKSQIAVIRNVGARAIFYHYGWPTNKAADEVAHFHDTVSPYLRQGDVLCLDWEFYGPSGNGVTADIANGYKDDWFKLAAQAFPGHRNILYTNRDRWTHIDVNSNAGDGLWIADYVTAGKPNITHAWVGHQYSDAGHFPGGGGTVDLNVWNFASLDEYDKWSGGATPPSFTIIPADYHTVPAKPTLPVVHVGHLMHAMHVDLPAATGHRSEYADEVKLLEQALAKTGWLDPKWVDGSYGSRTVGVPNPVGQTGCKGFQVKHSGTKNPDGWLGPKELDLLFSLAGMHVKVVL